MWLIVFLGIVGLGVGCYAAGYIHGNVRPLKIHVQVRDKNHLFPLNNVSHQAPGSLPHNLASSPPRPSHVRY